ncbi:MAG: hypothetical protein LBT05_14075 [Planctomycetaceae bacterium]|jgi:hypothetical protein|nr:hypothetical protein [Planctomycetaceae bacterium]
MFDFQKNDLAQTDVKNLIDSKECRGDVVSKFEDFKEDNTSSENEQEQSSSLENNRENDLELDISEITDLDSVIDTSEESADTLANAREFAFLEGLLPDSASEEIKNPVAEISAPTKSDSNLEDLSIAKSYQSEKFSTEEAEITSEFLELHEEIPEIVEEEASEEPANFFELPEENLFDEIATESLENTEESSTAKILDSSETLEEVSFVIDSFEDSITEELVIAEFETTANEGENFDAESKQALEVSELSGAAYGENIELLDESDLLEQIDSLPESEEAVLVEQSEEQFAEKIVEPVAEKQTSTNDLFNETEAFSFIDITNTESIETSPVTDNQENLNDVDELLELDFSESETVVSLDKQNDEAAIALELPIETSDETVDLLTEFPETRATEEESIPEMIRETAATEGDLKTKKKSKKEKSPKVKKEKLKKEKPIKPQRSQGDKQPWTIGFVAFVSGIVIMALVFAAVNARVILSDGLSGMWYVWLGAFDLLAVASIAITFFVRRNPKRTDADVAIGIAAISALIGCMVLLIHLIYIGNV